MAVQYGNMRPKRTPMGIGLYLQDRLKTFVMNYSQVTRTIKLPKMNSASALWILDIHKSLGMTNEHQYSMWLDLYRSNIWRATHTSYLSCLHLADDSNNCYDCR